MSSRGSNNGGGVGVQSIPPASRKMVQSLKEIVNCPEAEIYATLKECHMDPNEAVNRLLSQDPFHEVKSKRDKKKETKDSTDSRSRGGSNASNRGARSGMDRYVGRGGGSTQFSSSDSGGLHVKNAYKKENGYNPYTSSSSTAHGTLLRPPAPSDFANENKSSTLSVADGVSASQPSTGYQPAWVGAPGQKSMAEIVKMGRPQSKASSAPISSHYSGKHHLAHAPLSTESYQGLPSSEDHRSKVQDLYTEPAAAPDEWPLIEPPQASMSSVLEPRADSNTHPDHYNMPSNKINQQSHSETDEVEEEENSSVEIENLDHAASATVSSRNMQEEISGDASLFDNDVYKNMGSYQSHDHAFQSEEVEDVGASVSTETANMRQLSIQEEYEAYEEDVPSVVIPNHLQVQSVDCSHLSFGSFGTGLGTSYSDPYTSRSSRSNMEEAPVETDASVLGHSDTRNPEYYGDESITTAADGNLVHRTSGGAVVYDSPSAPQAEVLKQENSEVAHGNQYAFPSSSSGGYTFENTQQLNTAFDYSQTSSQMQNLTPFSSSMGSLPSTLLAANVHPLRESELPYSPFPMSQSMATKYGNTVSSVGGSSISVTEALKTGFQSVQSTPNLSGTGVATGPAVPQHLAVHPYSQPTLPLGPFANMISYNFMPQGYTYMPSAFQQSFAGNNTYHQSLAAVLPQYKNSVSVSNLPQSAGVPSGYGAFGSSTTIPANYAMNPQAASPAGSTIGYDDVLSSQYKDNNHLISLQQNDNSAMWLHGPGSRTISAVPASTYYSFQGQNQQPGGFRQGQQPSQNYGSLGYPNFYHSQAGMSLEHQQQNPRDGALSGSQGQPKQSQQIWQNGY